MGIIKESGRGCEECRIASPAMQIKYRQRYPPLRPLVLRAPGPLVRWSFGPSGSLVLRSPGLLLLRSLSSGHLDQVPWSPSPLVLWSFSLDNYLPSSRC